MSLKFVVVFSLFAVTLGHPNNDADRGYGYIASHKQFLLSGVSGRFSYPETSDYRYDDIVLIQLPIEQQTVFTLERHDLDYFYDTLTIFLTGNAQAAVDESITGFSEVPTHYLEAAGFVTLILRTELVITHSGFTISWAPLH